MHGVRGDVSSWGAVDLRDEPRSRSAALHGGGDGRDKLCDRFFDYWHHRQPDLSEHDLCYRFERYTFRAMVFSKRWLGIYGAVNNRTSIFLLRFWMLLGWFGPK